MSRGKKIDTWKVTHEGVTVEFPVFMHKGDHTDSGKTIFRAEIKEYDLRGSDTDADKLRAYMVTEFRKRLSINWRPMLRVCFGGQMEPLLAEGIHGESRVRFRSDSKLKMRVERLWVGEDFMGNPLYCENRTQPDEDDRFSKSNVRQASPDVGLIDTEWWSSARVRDADGVAALIPDTAENRVAVQRIIDGMEKLCDRLREFLRPEQIETTLALVSQNMLLLSGSGGEAPPPAAD